MARPCSQPQAVPISAGGEERQGPAPAGGLGRGADGEAALEAALGDDGGTQAGQRHDRAHRQVDAAGEDDEGHADGEQAVDRDLAHDVEQVERLEEARLDDGEHGHQDQEEDQGREPGEEAEQVDLAGRRCPASGRHGPLAAHVRPPVPARIRLRRMEPGTGHRSSLGDAGVPSRAPGAR